MVSDKLAGLTEMAGGNGGGTAGQVIVKLYVWLPVHPLVSVAVTMNVYAPDVMGVPERTPADDKPRSVGNAPDVME
jgi:hypothetical protein